MFSQSQKRHLFHQVMMALPTGKRTKGVNEENFFFIPGHFEFELMG